MQGVIERILLTDHLLYKQINLKWKNSKWGINIMSIFYVLRLVLLTWVQYWIIWIAVTNKILSKRNPKYTHYLFNRQFRRITTAERVSKQSSHPFHALQKWQSYGFLYGLVNLPYAPNAFKSYWLYDRCGGAFMLKNISCRQWCQSVVIWANVLRFLGASVH